MDAKIAQCTTIFSEILSIPTMGNTLVLHSFGSHRGMVAGANSWYVVWNSRKG
jgi:hypothetical protein